MRPPSLRRRPSLAPAPAFPRPAGGLPAALGGFVRLRGGTHAQLPAQPLLLRRGELAPALLVVLEPVADVLAFDHDAGLQLVRARASFEAGPRLDVAALPIQAPGHVPVRVDLRDLPRPCGCALRTLPPPGACGPAEVELFQPTALLLLRAPARTCGANGADGGVGRTWGVLAGADSPCPVLRRWWRGSGPSRAPVFSPHLLLAVCVGTDGDRRGSVG